MLVAFRCLLDSCFFILAQLGVVGMVKYAACPGCFSPRKETHGIRYSPHCQAPPVTTGNMEFVMVPKSLVSIRTLGELGRQIAGPHPQFLAHKPGLGVPMLNCSP